MSHDSMRDSILEFTDGDAVAAHTLRDSLAALAEQHAATPLGRRISEVLAGRAEFRSLAEDLEFSRLALEGARAWEQAWVSLDPEERARLAAHAARE